MIRPRSALFFIVLAGAGLRLAAVPSVIGDLDAANFAAALEHFDPLRQAPHWPAYPVYVALTKLLGSLPTVLALALPGVIGWMLAAPLFFAGLRRALGPDRALAITAAAAALPGAVLVGAWPGSDGLGVALLLAGVGAALLAPSNVRFAALAGVLVGLGIGTRLSWWPLFAAIALMAGRRRTVIMASVATTVVWALGLFVVVGTDSLVHAIGFGAGHFDRFGGALQPHEPLITRATVLAQTIGDAFGGPLVLVIVGAGIGAAFAARGAQAHGTNRAAVANRPPYGPALVYGAAGVVGYATWLFLAQNVARPRHVVPIALVLAAIAAVGWMRTRVVLPAAFVVALLPLAAAQRAPSPHARLANAIAERPGPVQVFVGPEGRLIERLVPGVRVWRPANGEVLAREAALAHARGATVLVTSHALGAREVDGLEVVDTFEQPRAVRGPDHRSTLYLFRSEVIDVASR